MPKRPEVMHLDLDAFFASVEQKLKPSLRGKPVIVCNVDPQGRTCYGSIVSTCSYEARKFGIKSGMATFQAKRLCPNGFFVKGSFGDYEKHSLMVFEIIRRFAPKVSPVSLDEAFLDFSNTNIIYPNLVEVAKEIKATIKKEAGLTASIGLASTKVVAKVASDFNKPDGLTVVARGEEKSFLSPLPLRDLPGIGVQTEKVFLKWGLKTIGDLANLSEKHLENNLGKVGLTLWNQANGRDSIWFEKPSVFDTTTQQKSISHSTTFPEKSNDKRYLLRVLQFLTEKVCLDLREKNLMGGILSVHIRYSDFTSKGMQKVLPFASNGTKFIYKGAEQLFLKLWDGASFVRLTGVGLSHLSSDRKNSQLTLFDQEERLSKLDNSVDKLREKYGFSSVLPASLVEAGEFVVKYRQKMRRG